MPQGKGGYHSLISTVPIPREYKPLVDAEMEKLKVYTVVQAMGHILRAYFGPVPAQNSSNGENPGPDTLPPTEGEGGPTPQESEEVDNPWASN
jgi:hypothetical protein